MSHEKTQHTFHLTRKAEESLGFVLVAGAKVRSSKAFDAYTKEKNNFLVCGSRMSAYMPIRKSLSACVVR